MAQHRTFEEQILAGVRSFSKYQRKKYEIVDYDLHEYHCGKCDGYFTMDESRCDYGANKNGESYMKYFCPYCGHKHFQFI